MLLLPMVAFVLPMWSAHSADTIDQYVEEQMKSLSIPGASLLVVQDRKVLKRRAYGVSDTLAKTAETPEMICDAGSIGKTFTAAVVMQLVDQGKLSLSNTLEKYVVDCPESWKPITVKQLLSHITGIPDYALVPSLTLLGDWTHETWFRDMRVLPLDFKTGTQFGYSNSNYFLLAHIVEAVTKKKFDDVMKERVFSKSGLKNTFRDKDIPKIKEYQKGYFRQESEIIPGLTLTAGFGDGGVITCVDDLVRYEQALQDGKILKPETLKQMQTAAVLTNGRKSPYGYGWFVRDVYGHTVLSHGGNAGGTSGSLTRVPESNLVIAILFNINDISGDSIALGIATRYLAQLAPPNWKEAPDPKPDFTGKLTAALEGLARRETAQDIFDQDYVARLATSRGRMGLGAYSPFAKIDSVKFLMTEPFDIDRIIRYRMTANSRSYIVAFIVTKQDKIYSIAIRAESG